MIINPEMALAKRFATDRQGQRSLPVDGLVGL